MSLGHTSSNKMTTKVSIHVEDGYGCTTPLKIQELDQETADLYRKNYPITARPNQMCYAEWVYVCDHMCRAYEDYYGGRAKDLTFWTYTGSYYLFDEIGRIECRSWAVEVKSPYTCL